MDGSISRSSSERPWCRQQHLQQRPLTPSTNQFKHDAEDNPTSHKGIRQNTPLTSCASCWLFCWARSLHNQCTDPEGSGDTHEPPSARLPLRPDGFCSARCAQRVHRAKSLARAVAASASSSSHRRRAVVTLSPHRRRRCRVASSLRHRRFVVAVVVVASSLRRRRHIARTRVLVTSSSRRRCRRIVSKRAVCPGEPGSLAPVCHSVVVVPSRRLE